MLQQAQRIYEAVNLSGKLNHATLCTERLMAEHVTGRMALRVQQRQRAAAAQPSQRAPVAVARDIFDIGRDRAMRARADFKGAMAIGLHLTRTFPLFWFNQSGSHFLSFQFDLYPLCELLVGRGHAQTLVPIQDNEMLNRVSGLTHLSRVYHQASHHGLAGAVLEKPFLYAASHFESRQQMVAATACMFAAVIGRTVLQPVRLVVCVAACIRGAQLAITFVACSYTAEFVLRALRLAVKQATQISGHDSSSVIDRLDWWQRAVDPRNIIAFAVNELEDQLAAQRCLMNITTIEPTQADRASEMIRRRNAQDMRKFMAVANENGIDQAQERTRVVEIAEEIANTYRQLTSRLPDQSALRFGLRLVKDFVDLQWGEDYFNPPELA